MIRIVRLLVIVSVLGAAAAEAQVQPGNMIGVVRDESSAVLPGATVTVTSPALPGGPVTVTTNAQGEYRITPLPPGTYTLSIALAGFSTYEEADLRVAVGGTTERNVRLPLSSLKESITVKGDAPLIDPRQTGIGQTLSTEVVESLPNKRFTAAASFMTDLPGVTVGNMDSAYSVNVMGSTGAETPLMVDGVVTNHPASGGGWTHFDLDAIGEVSATTLGASPEFQGAAGGVLNVITKAGTNQLRGDAAGFWAPQALSSQPITLPCNCPDGQTGFTWYKNRDLSTHLGGPIKRNRAWFYGGLTFTGQSASTPGQAPLKPQDQYLVWFADPSAKLAVKLTDRVHVQQTYYEEAFFEPLPHFPTITRPLETIQRSYGAAGLWGKGLPHGASELTATLSDKSVLTARYALTNLPDQRIGFNNDLITPRRVDSATGINSGNFTAFRSKPRRDEVDVKMNTYLTAGGVANNVSYGLQFIRNRIWRATVEPGGIVYSDFNGQPDQATFTPPSIDAAQYNAQVAWGEDEITFRRKLTIKVGARLDRLEGISSDAPAVDSHFQDTGNTIAGLGRLLTWTTVSPRVGVNLKLTESGSTVLRAIAGRYYDSLTLTSVEAVHPGVAVTTLARYDPATRGYTTIISVTDPRANIAFDRNMNTPYTDQYSVGVDRRLVSNLAAAANYVHKRAANQIATLTTGAVYGTQQIASPAGGTLTVFPLTSRAADRIFLTTNGPGYYTTYDALILSLTKRYSHRWQGNVGYAYASLKGLTSGAVDPNDVTNAEGPQSIDRPNMLTITGAYDVPRIDVQFSGNLVAVQGTPYAPVVQIALPQGRRSINIQQVGSYRGPVEQHLYFRISKILFRADQHRLELSGELRNALQDTANQTRITTVYGNPNFGLQSSWPDPRQLLLRARVYF
jgi:carboxypeptidase family protein